MDDKPVSQKWCSVFAMLLDHGMSPGVLATAIEHYGVFVIDRYGRKAEASVDGSDEYSQNFCLELIADRQAEIEVIGPRDPLKSIKGSRVGAILKQLRNDGDANTGPLDSFDDVRWDIQDHPLERFGWPKNLVPDLSQLTAVESQTARPKGTPNTPDWVSLAQSEAIQVIKKSARPPTQDKVAYEVAKTLQAKGVTGARGALTQGNIKRTALGSSWWREHGPKKYNN